MLALLSRPEIDLSHDELSRCREELDDALTILEANDCLDNPASFHQLPPPIEKLARETSSWGRIPFEVLTFESGYQTLMDLPGTHRWNSMVANRRVSAFVLQHGDKPRPWVVNLHGFGSGRPMDLLAMRALGLHRDLGYNVLHPVFPLHGSRRPDPVDPRCTILSFDLVNTIHFFSQAIWDVRRMLGWIRSQGATSISVHGVSMGAYTGAVVSGLEDLDRAILGLGAVDLPAAKTHSLEKDARKTIEDYGLIGEAASTLFKIISPAAMECRVSPEQRFVYGGVGDRFAPGGTYELWNILGQPNVHWHAGGHLTGCVAPSVWRFVFDALRDDAVGGEQTHVAKLPR